MNNLSNLYNGKYVNKIVAKQWRYDTVDTQIKILYDYFKPTSIIDIGAANGLHTNSWRNHGCTTFGIEGTKHFKHYLEKNTDEFAIQDIRKPFDLGKKFDLVTSVEVLEHIEKEYVDIAVDNICRHGDTLFITANPSKRGKSHVNPQPKQYWIDLFVARGYKYEKEETEQLAYIFNEKCPDSAGWYIVYSMVFRKI